LRDEGCSINNVTYHPQVWSPQEAKGVDLLIVALKYGALPGALASIREAVGPNTTVMSLMNGVDSEKIIAGAIDSKQILPALIKIASRHDGNGVRFNPEKTIGIVFGEAQAPFESERVLAIEALMRSSDIHIRHTDCINEEIWCKFRLNVCNNLPQAVIGAGLGCYRDSEHMRAIKEGLRRELEDIAAAMGQKGTMSALRRVAAGVYTEADAHTLEEIQAAKDAGPAALEALMLPVESVFASLPLLTVAPKVEQHLYNGCPTSRYPAADGRYRVRNEAGQFLGLANIVGGVLRVEKLFVERN